MSCTSRNGVGSTNTPHILARICVDGLIIVMGLPNATSIQQEMDALYGPFKSATYARGEQIVQEKLRV